MKIYKLKYNNREEGITDFFLKGILFEFDFDGETIISYGDGVSSVVELGDLMLVPPVYDDNGELLTEAIYDNGYCFDIMTENTYDFGTNEVYPENPLHSWFGIDPNDYVK
jgi:hypothetical protein